MDQADGLRCLMKRQVCLDTVKAIQVELRQAIIAGKYKDADTLMVLLEQAQKELEETYLTPIKRANPIAAWAFLKLKDGKSS